MDSDGVFKRRKGSLGYIYDHNKVLEDRVWTPECDIFVSAINIGTTQDWFVAQLCEDLRRRNRVPFFEAQDARMSTSNIEEYEFCYPTIAKWKMVVVVVSEEYCTSSCKLTQLHAIMKTSVKNKYLKILPVFFGLNVDEICKRQEGWFKVLEETTTFNASWPNKLDDWKQSLKWILGFNGLVYINQDSGLVTYRKEIVSNICKVVPPTMSLWDELRFHDRSQLCKDVRQHFENIPYSTKIPGVHVMGLYGMSGVGKSLLCKGMCRELDGEFDGKVCHLQLDNRSEESLLMEVLTTLTNINMPRIPKIGKEQFRKILFNNMTWKQKTFLAMETVQNSLVEANMFLQAPFVEGSWVIVTSRFKETLRSLNIDESACFEMLESGNIDTIFQIWEWKLSEGNSGPSPMDALFCPSLFEDERKRFVLEGAFQLQPVNTLPNLEQPECSTLTQSHSQSSPKTQQGFTFKPDKNKKGSLSLQVQTESVEPLSSEGMTSDVTMSIEALESLAQLSHLRAMASDVTVSNEELESVAQMIHQQGFTFKPDKNKKGSLSLQVQTESVEPLSSEGMTSDVTMSIEELESVAQMIHQQGFTFKPDKNKKGSLSLQVQTESVEPLSSEGMTSDVTMSIEKLESVPQMIQPMDIGHDPTSFNEGSKESSSQVLSSFCEELQRLTRSLSLRKVCTPREQSANLTLDQFLDNYHLHNPGAMLIAGRVQVSNRQLVQFVFKDGEELAQVVGVGCFGQHAVVNITKSLKVQVVHDEDTWHQIWNEAIIGGSSSQLMTFLKNSRSQSTIDDVTTLGNLSSQRLAKQFGVGLERDSHLQSSVKVHNQEKGRREFLILMFARYLLLDEILETKFHDDYVEAFEQNFPFCEESFALRKSANLHDGVSSGEWIWTSTLWANLWNYLPSLVNNVGNTQLGTGRGVIGDGGHGHGGDGGDGGRDRDDNSGGDGVLPLPPPDLDLENDGFAIVEVHPGYGGRWDNKDLVDKDLQVSTITPILTFHFKKSKERRELNVVLNVTFDVGEVVGPKPRDEEELRFGWFHDNLKMSLQSSDDDAAFLKSDRQVVDEPDISTTTSSTSSSITSNPFHVSFEAPGCSRSSPSSFIGLRGTFGVSKDFKSRNTQVSEMTNQLINKQVLGGFHYQDTSTVNKNSKFAFRYVFPSIPKDRVIHDDTTRSIYMVSGLCSTISPTVQGTWHQLNMSEASPYAFHSSRTFYEIVASKKKGLLKDCRRFEQTYDLKLYINHAMTHIYEYIGKRNILEGQGKSCHLLDVGSVQEG